MRFNCNGAAFNMGLGNTTMFKCCSAILALMLLSSAPSRALTIDFSFTDTLASPPGVPGTVTGEIEGLTNGFSSATDIIIESAPGALGLVTPFDALASSPGLTLVQSNAFIVSNGNIITAALAFSTNYGAPPFYPLNWQFCMAVNVGGYCGSPSGAYLLNGSGMEVATDVSPTFTPVGATPLPAALPLFATGLGALGLFGWRRKRKNAATLAAA